MYEKVYGGKLISNKSGLYYNYDVFICAIPDAIVDCLGDVCRLISPENGPIVYASFREHMAGEDPKVWFYIRQIAARILGIEIWSYIIQGILNIICGK